jgi:hypothetical protein
VADKMVLIYRYRLDTYRSNSLTNKYPSTPDQRRILKCQSTRKNPNWNPTCKIALIFNPSDPVTWTSTTHPSNPHTISHLLTHDDLKQTCETGPKNTELPRLMVSLLISHCMPSRWLASTGLSQGMPCSWLHTDWSHEIQQLTDILIACHAVG